MQRRFFLRANILTPGSKMKTTVVFLYLLSAMLHCAAARHASLHDVIDDVKKHSHHRHAHAKEHAHRRRHEGVEGLGDAETSDFSRTKKQLDFSEVDKAREGRGSEADYPDYEAYFQDDEGSVDPELLSWGRYENPWDAPLFQWMKYPSLTHRPLSNWSPRAAHRDHDIHEASRRASRERDLRRHQHGANRDYESHGSGSRDRELRRRPDETFSPPLSLAGEEHELRLRQQGHRRRVNPPPPRPLALSPPPDDEDAEGENSGDNRRGSGYESVPEPQQPHGHRGLRHHTQPPTQDSNLAAMLAEIRQESQQRSQRRTAAKPQPLSTHRHRHYHEETDSRSPSQDLRRRLGHQDLSLNSLGQPLSSLPHAGEEIVYKLPTETDPRLQSRPIVYDSSAGRIPPVSNRDFLVLDRFAGEDEEREDPSNRRRPTPAHASTRYRSQPEERRTTPVTDPRGFRPGERRTSPVYDPRGSSPGYFPSTTRPDDSDRRRLSPSPASLDHVDRYGRRFVPRESEDSLPRSGDGEDASRSRPHHQGQGRRYQGHYQGHRGDGESSSCGRQLETCRRAEMNNRLLQRTYQTNLETLKRVLTEGLERMTRNPTQLLDLTLCDVINVASSTTTQLHDVTRSNYAAGQTTSRLVTDDVRRQTSRSNHDLSRTSLRHPSSGDRDDEDDDAFTDLRHVSPGGHDLDATDDNSDFVIDHTVAPPETIQRQGHRQGHAGRRDHHGHVTSDNRPQTGRVSSGGVDDDDVIDVDNNDDDGNEGEDSGELEVGGNGEEAQKFWRSWKQQKQEQSGQGNSEECRLGPWTDWSSPVGFGVIERRRFPLAETEKCKQQAEQADLVMRVDISVFNANHTYYKAPEEVGQDFEADFTRSVNPRDLLLVLDASGSIEEEDFELMREGVDVMVRLFCGGFGPNPNNNRLAILIFASEIHVVHRFSDDQSPEALRDVIANMTQPNGNTCTGDALKLAREDLFGPDSGARPGVDHDTLIVTDGHSNCGEVTIQEGAQLLQNVSNVFALGVGIANDTEARWELNSVVSNSNPRHIFSLARFQDFKDMLGSIEERQKTLPCLPIIDATTAEPDSTREG